VSTAHLILVMSVHLAALDHGVMDPALAALRAERQAAERIKAGDFWQDTGLVFTTSYDTPYEPRTFARRFALRCSKAGVRCIRVHDTRRTCASLLVALNEHPRVAIQILRHSQIAVTMQVYGEVPSEATHRTRSSGSGKASTGPVLLPHLLLHKDH
jgi:integrase